MDEAQKYIKVPTTWIDVNEVKKWDINPRTITAEGIDRLKNKYVVDFIYFKLIDFPVFNFADFCITIGCTILILSLIFVYKGEEI